MNDREHLEDQLERLRKEQAEDATLAHTMKGHYITLMQHEGFKFYLSQVGKMLAQREADALYGEDLPVPRDVKRGECVGISQMLELIPTSLNWAETVLRTDEEETEDDE